MNLGLFEDLFAHMEWADALVWRTVLSERSVAADDFALDSLIHLHVAQRAFLAVWRGEPFALMSRKEFARPAAIRDWARSYYPEASKHLRALDEEALGEVLPIPWATLVEDSIGGPASPANVGEMALQVVSHSTHHRAQINRRIRELGATPGMVDYIAWVWRGRPQADWGD